MKTITTLTLVYISHTFTGKKKAIEISMLNDSLLSCTIELRKISVDNLSHKAL